MSIYVTGTFLLIGADMEPAVFSLTKTAHESLNQGLAIAAKYGKPDARERVYKQVFGLPAQYAVPCWSVEAMTAIATGYVGPHAERVKGLAARIALGRTFGADEGHAGGDGKGPRGGTKAKLVPEKPKRPPGGAAADLLFANTGARS